MNSSEQYGIQPHGGTLVNRVLLGQEREEHLTEARRLPRILLDPISVSDLELIAVGAFSPLTGFQGHDDYENVLASMHLVNGLVWSIPITLPVSGDVAGRLRQGQRVGLWETPHHLLAVMTVSEVYGYDKQREAQQVYRTTDEKHPGVARLYAHGDQLLAGEIWLLNRPLDQSFKEFRHDPLQTRRMFAQRGWQTIVGFQTRNPIHRAHEYIQKTALEIVDGLLLHPLVGETKSDDIPADIRMQSYESLLRDYYPPDRVLLGVYPAAMRYAGPREAVFHAIARKNYGCTHFIVGRDHAGVGKYYGTYDAQLIFHEFRPEEIGLTPLFFEHAFYCRKCGGIVSPKTCPHPDSDHIVLSGTQVREMLSNGQPPPPEFTRPEVAQILIDGFRRQKETPTAGPASPTSNRKKVLVVGMDCMTPQFVFGEWRDELPNFRRMMDEGVWGELESTIPPITVPAWSCMTSSKDPGELGCYGFRNRADHSYERMSIVTSKDIKEDRLWDILSAASQPVIVVGVPQTYPPKPVYGQLVSCFLTPSTNSQYTHPPELKDEIQAQVGEYLLDVDNFRTEDKQSLLDQIYQMTDTRFALVKHLLSTKPWRFAMYVEMGPDRLHHAFWKYTDPLHPKYAPNSPFGSVIRDYYRHIDAQLGELLQMVDRDTIVMVVSDHGAKRMEGGVCINEWLLREGYLALKHAPPAGITPLTKVEIDWSKTIAWGEGGYYGRVFLNVRGREPQGVVAPEDYDRVCEELSQRLTSITDFQGGDMHTRVYRPDQIYRKCLNIPSDLIVLFGDLAWRSVGSLGHGSILTSENDTGPDDANHAQHGIFLALDPQRHIGRQAEGLHLMDIAPTVLDLLGMPVPSDMQGTIIRL